MLLPAIVVRSGVGKLPSATWPSLGRRGFATTPGPFPIPPRQGRSGMGSVASRGAHDTKGRRLVSVLPGSRYKIGHPGRAIRAAGGLFPFFQGVGMGSVTSRGAHDIRASAPQRRAGVGGANARMDHCDGQAVLYYPTEERELNQRRDQGTCSCRR